MGALIGVVLAICFLVIAGMALLLFIRFVLHALIFVFGTALVGAIIIGLSLQVFLNLAASGSGGSSADSTIPVLIAFLAFFVILALRARQWTARRDRPDAHIQKGAVAAAVAATTAQVDYPEGYEAVADAWRRAIKIASDKRDDLAGAEVACAELLTAVEHHDGIPDGEVMETIVLIRNHLAALVGSTERRLRGATAAGKKATVEEMVTLLLGYGQRARQDLEACGLTAEEDDAALRAHLNARLFR